MELLGCAGSSCREMAAWAKAREMEQPGLPAQKPSRHSAIFPLRDSRDGGGSHAVFWGIHLLQGGFSPSFAPDVTRG